MLLISVGGGKEERRVKALLLRLYYYLLEVYDGDRCAEIELLNFSSIDVGLWKC